MKLKNLHTGKLEKLPTQEDMQKAKSKNLADKRRQYKRDQAEQREQQKIQDKNDNRKARDKFNTTPELQESTSKLLKEIMAERKITVKDGGIFDAFVQEKLGKKLIREARSNKNKVLAVGSAVYHELAAQKNSVEALHRLAESAGVEVNRITDRPRIIIECLVDYGSKGRSDDRQFVARDARALSWVIRQKMTPDEIMKPKPGENITVWAKREAGYRSQQKAQTKARKKAPEKPLVDQPLPGQLPSLLFTQTVYKAIKDLADRGVVVVGPKGGGEPLALVVVPLKMTTKKAIKRPGKVISAVKKIVNKTQLATMEPADKEKNEW